LELYKLENTVTIEYFLKPEKLPLKAAFLVY
jgi:hypothetical protein